LPNVEFRGQALAGGPFWHKIMTLKIIDFVDVFPVGVQRTAPMHQAECSLDTLKAPECLKEQPCTPSADDGRGMMHANLLCQNTQTTLANSFLSQ